MEDAGQKLGRARERTNLRVRGGEQASQRISEKYHTHEFTVLINRISEIENQGLGHSIYERTPLSAIYRLDFAVALEWYGIDLAALPADSLFAEVSRTHAVGYHAPLHGDIAVPLSLDPGVDLRRTTYMSRMIQRWGTLSLMLLAGLDRKERRYGFIGTDDWFMYPMLQPGSFVVIDETSRKIQADGWTSEFERPIYFLETREGYLCGWCSQNDEKLVLLPHPASGETPIILSLPSGVAVVGHVPSVAMILDQGRRRRERS